MIDTLSLSHNRILFSRNLGNELVVIDFAKQTQGILRLSAPIISLYPIDAETFIVRSRNESWFSVTVSFNKLDAHISPVEIKAHQNLLSLPNGKGVLLHNYISPVAQAPTTIMNSVFSYAQLMEAPIKQLQGPAHVNSFLRPIASRSETSATPTSSVPPAEREGRVVSSHYLHQSKQLLNLCFVPPFEVDIDADQRLRKTMREEAELAAHWVLELVDLQTRSIRRIKVSARDVARKTILDAPSSPQSQWTFYSNASLSVAKILSAREMPNGDLLLLFDDGLMSIWEVDPASIQQQLQRWKSLMGLNPASDASKGVELPEKDRLRLQFEYDDGAKVSKELKVGQVDQKGGMHRGGSTLSDTRF